MELTQTEFQIKLIQLAEKDFRVKWALELVSYDFDKLEKEFQDYIFKKLGIIKVYTIKKYIIDEKSNSKNKNKT